VGNTAMLEMLGRVDTPALLVDLEALRSNIRTMAAFFEPLSAGLRPHFKTHKCKRIAHLQMDAGAIGMTCAKLGEAEILVSAGVRDVLIANQVVGPLKIEHLMGLLGRGADVKVALDDEQNARELSRATTAKGAELGVLVEVDVGMGRCGLLPGESLLELCRFVDDSKNLVFRGLMGYEGHTVFIEDRETRRVEATKALKRLEEARALVEDAGLEVEIVSAGGTGTYDVAGPWPGVTEVQAGSYVVLDARYHRIRPEFHPALSVLSTVVSASRRGVAVADAGLKSITTEFGLPEVIFPEGVKVQRLAEEHVILALDDGVALKVGDRILLLPSHCCTTINLHEEFVVVEHMRECGRWAIEGRGKVR